MLYRYCTAVRLTHDLAVLSAAAALLLVQVVEVGLAGQRLAVVDLGLAHLARHLDTIERGKAGTGLGNCKKGYSEDGVRKGQERQVSRGS